MTVISTNVASLNAQAALASNARGLGKAMQQLSTGTRINSAADDAAGLAVSTRLTSQIRGLNTAVRNANDAISMIQTAEGAAVEITNMLQRMRELSVQSANDTNKSDDRDFLNLEFQQLKSEINRIGGTTQWNGMNILDGSFVANTDAGKFIFQVGANAAQTVDITIGSFTIPSTAPTATGTAVAANPAATDSDAQNTGATDFRQTSTVTIGGTYRKGDVISISDGTSSLNYTVTDSDVAASNVTDTIATNIRAMGLGSYTLTRTGSVISIQGAGAATQAASAFTITSSVAPPSLYNLNSTSVSSRSNANTAITEIDKSLTYINNQRATMGSVVNRLQYTVDNLTNVATKATESRSRVLDTDYSQATTELSKRQIISQAATAMLAQANQQPQTVLSLLK